MKIAIYSGFTHDLPVKNGGSVHEQSIRRIRNCFQTKNGLKVGDGLDFQPLIGALGPAGDCTLGSCLFMVCGHKSSEIHWLTFIFPPFKLRKVGSDTTISVLMWLPPFLSPDL